MQTRGKSQTNQRSSPRSQHSKSCSVGNHLQIRAQGVHNRYVVNEFETTGYKVEKEGIACKVTPLPIRDLELCKRSGKQNGMRSKPRKMGHVRY